MNLQQILREKGTTVHFIEPSATLDDVVQALVRNNCGSLVICEAGADGPRLAGIISERDVLRTCAARKAPLDRVLVSEVMTRKVITGSPGDLVEEAMGQMTVHRIRHLPILEEGRLAGIISIGDLVKAQHQQYAIENHYLKTYIQS